MSACAICGKENARYKFKCCKLPFCSAQCGKCEHSCSMTQQEELAATAQPERRANELKCFSPDAMSKLGSVNIIKYALSNSMNQRIITSIVTANNPREALKEAIDSNPAFSVLADSIVEACQSIPEVMKEFRQSRSA